MKQALLTLIVIVIVVGVSLLVLDKFFIIAKNDTYALCCNFSVCSDTYYDNVTDLCVLTLTGETYKPVYINETYGVAK